MRILISKDDKISRLMLKAMLGNWEHDVVVAHDGLEAWQMLQAENGPRFAILDWMMPNTYGLEVCRKVRKIGEG